MDIEGVSIIKIVHIFQCTTSALLKAVKINLHSENRHKNNFEKISENAGAIMEKMLHKPLHKKTHSFRHKCNRLTIEIHYLSNLHFTSSLYNSLIIKDVKFLRK